MDDTTSITERPTLSSPTSTAEAEALAGYQSLSVLAMVALALGLASPLVFVGRVLLAIPLFGVAVSLVALAKIAAANGQLSGRWAALVGLCLSVGCLCAAEGRTLAAHWRMASQAQSVCRGFINHLLANEPETAFAMTAAAQRASVADPEEPGPPGLGPSKPPLEEFLDQPVVQSLLEMGEGAQAQFLGTAQNLRTTPYQAVVQQRFRIKPAADGGENSPLSVVITLEQRGRVENGVAPAWRIAAIEENPAEK